MWYRQVYFQYLVSDVLVERGDVGVVMEVMGGGVCESLSVSLSDASLALSEGLLVCWCPAAARRDCQDGRGAHLSGRSGSGVAG